MSAETSNGLRASAALSAAIESLGQLQTVTLRSMAAGVLSPAAQQEIVAANAGVTEAFEVPPSDRTPGFMTRERWADGSRRGPRMVSVSVVSNVDGCGCSS